MSSCGPTSPQPAQPLVITSNDRRQLGTLAWSSATLQAGTYSATFSAASLWCAAAPLCSGYDVSGGYFSSTGSLWTYTYAYVVKRTTTALGPNGYALWMTAKVNIYGICSADGARCLVGALNQSATYEAPPVPTTFTLSFPSRLTFQLNDYPCTDNVGILAVVVTPAAAG